MRSILRVTCVVVVVGALALVGCAGAAQDPGKLQGDWELESLGGTTALRPADSAVMTTLTFDGNKVVGNGGVNSFGSTFKADGKGNLSIEPVVSTEMAGPEPAMTQESEFFAALETTRHFEFDGDKLVLSDIGNNTLAVLVPK